MGMQDWMDQAGISTNGYDAGVGASPEEQVTPLRVSESGELLVPPRLRKVPVLNFGELPEPKPREYVWEGLIPEACCTVIYGDGGVAKSMLAMSLAIGLTSGQEQWMGRALTPQGVVYLDLELSADEQHRRAKALLAGNGGSQEMPAELLYLSALGHTAEEAFGSAYAAMHEAQAGVLVVDSFGLALDGEANSATDVIAFYRRYLRPFEALGYSVLLIDHQAKGGEYQRATAYGSVYKRNLVRSELQIEKLDQDEHAGTLNLVIRHTKHNFGPLAKPAGAQVRFKDDAIETNMNDLSPRVLAREQGTRPTDRARLVFAYEAELTAKELADETDMHVKTALRALKALERAGEATETGQRRRGLDVYRHVPSTSVLAPPRPHEEWDEAPEDGDSVVAHLHGEEDLEF